MLHSVDVGGSITRNSEQQTRMRIGNEYHSSKKDGNDLGVTIL